MVLLGNSSLLPFDRVVWSNKPPINEYTKRITLNILTHHCSTRKCSEMGLHGPSTPKAWGPNRLHPRRRRMATGRTWRSRAWTNLQCKMQEIIVGMSGLDRIIFQTNINGDPQILMGILWDSQDLKQPNLSGCSYQGCVCVFICQLLLRLWGRWTWIRLITAVWAAPKSRGLEV